MVSGGLHPSAEGLPGKKTQHEYSIHCVVSVLFHRADVVSERCPCLRISWKGVCLEEWSWSLTVLIILELVSSGLFPGWLVFNSVVGRVGVSACCTEHLSPDLVLRGFFLMFLPEAV